MTHKDLVVRAEKWLIQQGCGITIRDPFRACTICGEEPDVIGWRDGISILIECKMSRSDFFADQKKSFRIIPENGMGDWRFFLTPPEIIVPEDLPDGWGLLWAKDKIIKKIYGVPTNAMWWKQKPFEPCKRSETIILVSALRRLKVQGYLSEIYEGLPNFGVKSKMET